MNSRVGLKVLMTSDTFVVGGGGTSPTISLVFMRAVDDVGIGLKFEKRADGAAPRFRLPIALACDTSGNIALSSYPNWET